MVACSLKELAQPILDTARLEDIKGPGSGEYGMECLGDALTEKLRAFLDTEQKAFEFALDGMITLISKKIWVLFQGTSTVLIE